MTDNLKHSTSYFHEAIAHAFEMFKNGYEPVMETPFQPRRLGSAFVTEYRPVRESLDEAVNFDIDKMDKALESERIKIPESLKMEEFDQFMQDRQLTIQQKWEAEEALTELAAQSQELSMYEVDKGQKLVYTREQLDELYWTDLQEVGYKFGVKGRNRNKLTNAILQAQEKYHA